MLVRIYRFLSSLSLSLWLTGGVIVSLGIGSFVSGEGSSINDMPLFMWLQEAPFALSWWLWLALVFLGLLVVNTIVCSIESLRTKAGKSRFLVLISPQVMHLGFLLIVLAHLLSARGAYKDAGQATEGATLTLPDKSVVTVERISAQVGKMGMVTDFAAELKIPGGKTVILQPNRPWFHNGLGLYLKHVEPYPVPTAFLEAHVEPGAGVALAGALLFTIGNVVLLAVRRGR